MPRLHDQSGRLMPALLAVVLPAFLTVLLVACVVVVVALGRDIAGTHYPEV